ncbi:MAG: PAS domain-containing protein [Magnetospirillum sp.]|nr:PAS domain-containing protein [Magnetospirillum sp.]
MEPGDNVIDLAKERRRRGPRFNGGLMDILEVSRDLVCLCRQGAITAINGAGARMLGAATTDELVGRRMDEFLVPEYGSMLELFLSGLASEDKAVPTRILALDKSVKAVEMQTFRAREIAPDATVVVCRELGAQPEAAGQMDEADLNFRLLVDNGMNMACHVQDGVVRYVNHAGVALLGAEGPEALVGRALLDLMDGPSGVIVDGDGLRALAEVGAVLPLTLRTALGDTVAVLARFTLVPSASGVEVMMEACPTGL